MKLTYDRSVTFPQGFKANGKAAGIKASGLPDLGIIISEVPAATAAVFTSNRFKAAPVTVSRENLKKSGSKSRAIIVNSGCANALTGKNGLKAAEKTVSEVARHLKIPKGEVLVASTGVIGRQLPLDAIVGSIPDLIAGLKSETDNVFPQSIMTTDKFPKQVSTEVSLSKGKTFRIGATAKGAGMIHPNMATMLCFVTTDARIAGKKLQAALDYGVARSFNAITVDGDTSTNDSVFLMANGASGTEIATSSEYELFREALTEVLAELAKMIVRDGEGATRFVSLKIQDAANFREAVTAGRIISVSPLVKTAIFGGDPNWGRIISALGNSDIKFDPGKIELKIGAIAVFRRGEPLKVDLKELEKAFMGKEIELTIRLNAGKESAQVYTCDLSYDYVKINGEYTT